MVNRMEEVMEVNPTMVATPSAFDPANETDITRTSEAANPKIVARRVNVHYAEKQALFDVDLDIPANTVTSFIGPSGCGKSTFLRCINRMNDTIPICRVDGGIALDGKDIHDPSIDVVELRARVGMVFQKPNPFPKSIYENVAYGPKIHGMTRSKAELDELVHGALRKAGLWNEVKDRLQEPGTGLSGGQQQRLCIARAIATRPEVLLMDEPCFGARSDRDGDHRGVDRRAAGELHDRDRDAFDAAGRAGQPADGVLPSGQPDRGGSDGGHLLESARAADGGLHLGADRLRAVSRPISGVLGRTDAQCVDFV